MSIDVDDEKIMGLKLKSCPFCGSDALVLRSDGDGYYVQCICGARGPLSNEFEAFDEEGQCFSDLSDQEIAVKGWNNEIKREKSISLKGISTQNKIYYV